jgi:hypothetical protein
MARVSIMIAYLESNEYDNIDMQGHSIFNSLFLHI